MVTTTRTNAQTTNSTSTPYLSLKITLIFHKVRRQNHVSVLGTSPQAACENRTKSKVSITIATRSHLMVFGTKAPQNCSNFNLYFQPV